MTLFELVGPASQVSPIKTMAATLTAKLEDKIQPVSVILKTRAEMPERADGGVSYGYWKKALRQIWLWEETDDYPVDKTLAHEAMHVVDRDWLTSTQRADIIKLMVPEPTAWADVLVSGVPKRYIALPYEVFAVYASARVCGIEKPAYRSIYVRSVPVQLWQKLAEVTLRDDGQADRGAHDVEEIPSPPDLMKDLPAELALAQAQLADAVAAKEAAELAQAAAESKLSAAKTKAGEIGAL